MSNSGLSPAGPIGGRDPPTDKTCQVSMQVVPDKLGLQQDTTTIH